MPGNARPLGQLCGEKLVSVAAQESHHLPGLKSRRPHVLLFAARDAYGRLLHLFGGSQHFLRAIGQTIDLTFGGTFLIAFESPLNPTQHGFEWNACVLPGFNQRPIQGRKQQDAAPAPLKVLFDFGEVIEVVFHGPLSETAGLAAGNGLRSWRGRSPVCVDRYGCTHRTSLLRYCAPR